MNLNRLRTKAMHSNCCYRVAAVALDAKGRVLSYKCNEHRLTKKGGGLHAEVRLIRRYGRNIRTMVIARTSATGKFLPISPCASCQELMQKLDIEWVTVVGEP